jgi:hypothetical protein
MQPVNELLLTILRKLEPYTTVYHNIQIRIHN